MAPGLNTYTWGLRPGDVIYAMNQRPVESVQQLRSSLQDLKQGTAVVLQIERGNQLFERLGKVLDGELGKHRFVAGDNFTAADLVVGADMCVAGMAEFPMAQFSAIRRWYDELQSLPSWQKTIAMQRPPAA